MKNKNYLIVAITLLVITIGGTFAYFIAQTGAGAKANANITADTVDDLKFSVSKEGLSLSANQFNFAQGSGNLSDSVTATASLKANSTKSLATYNYYVYFQIESNNYIYTTTDQKPEIVLSITGPNGEVTSVDGLTYVSASDADGNTIKGFDITEQSSSVIKIADSYEISSSSSTNYTNQDWVFKVTFVNLNDNQTDNEGNSLTGKVLIQKEKMPETIAEVVSSGSFLDAAIIELGTKGASSVTGLYHHDENLANGATDDSYRYAGANQNNYVCFGSDEETCPSENLYRIIGVFNRRVKLISADYSTTDMLGTDGSFSRIFYNTTYGYAFNHDSYKGTGDLSKIGLYYWDTTGKNLWSTSNFNLTNLNTNFISYLENRNSKWRNLIDSNTWYVGGLTYANGAQSNAKTTYDYEVGLNKDATATINSIKIGLMYVSDYYYSALPEYWSFPGIDLNGSYNDDYSVWSGNDYIKASVDNWLYMGLREFTISCVSDVSDYVFGIADVGDVSKVLVGGFGVDGFVGNAFAVRPSFYLVSSAGYDSGTGTISDPIRVLYWSK